MTQCTKQFDPLKKCRKREGTEVAHINIDLKDEKPISAYRSGDYHILGAHFPCGHYWPSHLDAPQDLINVEEEGEDISPAATKRLHKVSESCAEAIFSLMQQLMKLKEVLGDLSR